MPSENKLLETIEHYLQGKLTPDEQQAFDVRIQSDAALASEVEAYRSLLEGMNALQAQDFNETLSSWENEWDSAKEEDIELILWYLTDKLEGKQITQVEQRILVDTAFAEKVEQYKTILEGFGAIQMAEFSATIRGWEQETTPSTKTNEAEIIPMTKRLRWLAVAASVLVLLFTGYWYAQSNYSNTAIIADMYSGPRDSSVMGDNQGIQGTIDQQFRQAHQLFNDKKYEASINAFDALLEAIPNTDLDNFTKEYYTESAEWTQILAQLAKDGKTDTLKENVANIANKDGHDHQKEAKALLSKLNSFWKQITK